MLLFSRKELQLRRFSYALLFRRYVQGRMLDAVATDRRSCQRSHLLGSKGGDAAFQCLTEAKAHGALPPYPPSNLDRMDKNARNLNTKFKLSEKIEKITAHRFHSKL
jgi:hypothetical protein